MRLMQGDVGVVQNSPRCCVVQSDSFDPIPPDPSHGLQIGFTTPRNAPESNPKELNRIGVMLVRRNVIRHILSLFRRTISERFLGVSQTPTLHFPPVFTLPSSTRHRRLTGPPHIFWDVNHLKAPNGGTSSHFLMRSPPSLRRRP